MSAKFDRATSEVNIPAIHSQPIRHTIGSTLRLAFSLASFVTLCGSETAESPSPHNGRFADDVRSPVNSTSAGVVSFAYCVAPIPSPLSSSGIDIAEAAEQTGEAHLQTNDGLRQPFANRKSEIISEPPIGNTLCHPGIFPSFPTRTRAVNASVNQLQFDCIQLRIETSISSTLHSRWA